jgi:hypothetical protein
LLRRLTLVRRLALRLLALVRWLTLIWLALVLLIAILAHLRVARLHLLVQLILLVVRQHAHNLAAQFAAGAWNALAPFRVRLRELSD